jgi:hypothetical protein
MAAHLPTGPKRRTHPYDEEEEEGYGYARVGRGGETKRYRAESEVDIAGADVITTLLAGVEREKKTTVVGDSIPSSSRKYNQLERVYKMEPKLHSTCVVASQGRGAVLTSQSIIDLAIIKPTSLYMQRARVPAGDEQIAPLGSKDCFGIMQGEWLYSVYDPSGLTPRTTLDQDAEAVAFSTVNGLSVHTPIRFLGIAATVNHSEQENTDDRSAAIISGTVTGVNLGPETIPQFSLVCFSARPHQCPRGVSGGKMPAIQEVGIPVDKFRPATYPLRDANVYTSCLRMRTAVAKIWMEGKWDKSADAADGDSYTPIMTRYKEALKKIDEEMRKVGGPTGIEESEILPVKAYGFWVNLSCLLQEATTYVESSFEHFEYTLAHFETSISTIITFIGEVCDAVGKCAEICHQRQESKEYEEQKFGRIAAHETELFPSMKIIKDIAEGFKKKFMARIAIRSAGSGTSASVDEKGELHKGKYKIATSLYALMHETQTKELKAICEQANWQRRHIMGMSLSTSAPGKPLNLMMGYYAY